MAKNNTTRLSEGELAIIKTAMDRNEPNIFTDWFLRSDTTGTYYRPNALTETYIQRYDILHDHWEIMGRPRKFEKPTPDGELREYEAQFSRMYSDRNRPVFFNNHGYRFLPWQLEARNSDKHIVLELAGYGAGKTAGVVLDQLYKAATLPGYRAIFCAPQEKQVREAFLTARNMMEKSIYKDKFLLSINNKDLKIRIGNELVGDFNMMEFYPIGDGVEKIETFTVDDVVVDQADQFNNLAEIRRVIGTRQRGHVRGREIDGHIYFLANSKDAEIWNFYDELVEDKDDAFVIQASTYDNVYITDTQLARFEKDVGGTDEAIRIHMKGGRPKGSGEHFPQDALDRFHNPALDDAMKYGLNTELPGYLFREVPRTGVIEWALPAKEGRNYLEICDPGSGNPPNRNAPCVLVWDITHFPASPATLTAFSWVYGNGDAGNWMLKFTEFYYKYKPIGMGVDTTGPQSDYPELLWAMSNGRISVSPMPMYLPQKMGYLNTTKTLLSAGMLQAPYIPPLFNQMIRYRLPDEKIPQDIVMALIMSAGWLQHIWFAHQEQEDAQQEEGNGIEGRLAPIGENRFAAVEGRR